MSDAGADVHARECPWVHHPAMPSVRRRPGDPLHTRTANRGDPVSVPVADVVSIQGQRVRVRCPLCSSIHEHKVRTSELGQTEHRAAGCGLTRSAADRATGYMFTTTKEK
jgi:hypothetical protein